MSKKTEQDKKFEKVIIILLILFLLFFAIKCIITSWWNILLVIIILLALWWNHKREKDRKSTWQGTIIFLLALMLLVRNILPCVYTGVIGFIDYMETFEAQTLQENQINTAELQNQYEEEQKKLEEDLKKKAAEQQADEEEKKKAEQATAQLTPAVNYSEDRDCSDFSRQGEATSFMKASIAAGFGDHRLDRDGDGIACDD